MKKWEEIVRSKVEVSTETLPDKLYSEFLARLDAANAPTHSPKSSHKLLLALAPVAAIGLAVLLFLSKPNIPEGGVQIIQQPAAPIATVIDSNMDIDCNIDEEFTRQEEAKYASIPVSIPKEPEALKEDAPKPVEEEQEKIDAESLDADQPEETFTDNPSVMETVSPFMPENVPGIRDMDVNIIPATGAVVGVGLLAALVTPLLGGTKQNTMNSDVLFIDGLPSLDYATDSPHHNMPLKVGVTTRIPIADRFGVTTGLEYSLYSSTIKYSISGEKEQLAHYIGIPVRMDWIIASGKWLNVYVGGGAVIDYCLAATLAGNRIKKDGFCLSFLGTGGIQLNVSERAGLYLEPEITWTKPVKHATSKGIYYYEPADPMESRVLETYRTEHPLNFSIAAGLRINLGK